MQLWTPTRGNRALLWIVVLIASLIAPSGSVALAQNQNDSCVPIIGELSSAINSCDLLDINTACYGNAPAIAAPAEVAFSTPGQQQPVSAFSTIDTDLRAGAVLMMLNIEGDALPLRLILFGESTLIPETTGMNAFTYQGDGGGELCPQTPSGMVIRTADEGVGSITINGVEIDLESTAYIVRLGDSMVIANLEGRVTVTIDGQSQVIPVGYQSQILEIGTGQPIFAGPPTPSPLFASPVAQWLANSPEGLRRIRVSTAACGGSIAFGETVTARISTPGEECLYTFCSLEGRAVNIHLNRVDATVDPWVALRRPGGTLLKYNDDISEQNIDSRICNSTLPVVGCYTIVARSNDNSTGVFRLTLNQQTACAQPTPRCEVISAGLNQREGPGLNFPIIRTLPQGTPLRPLEGSTDRQWLRVLVANTSQEGWVSTSTQLLACEDVIPGPVTIVTPPPAVTPDEPDEPPPTPKPGPFGSP